MAKRNVIWSSPGLGCKFRGLFSSTKLSFLFADSGGVSFDFESGLIGFRKKKKVHLSTVNHLARVGTCTGLVVKVKVSGGCRGWRADLRSTYGIVPHFGQSKTRVGPSGAPGRACRSHASLARVTSDRKHLPQSPLHPRMQRSNATAAVWQEVKVERVLRRMKKSLLCFSVNCVDHFSIAIQYRPNTQHFRCPSYTAHANCRASDICHSLSALLSSRLLFLTRDLLATYPRATIAKNSWSLCSIKLS